MDTGHFQTITPTTGSFPAFYIIHFPVAMHLEPGKEVHHIDFSHDQWIIDNMGASLARQRPRSTQISTQSKIFPGAELPMRTSKNTAQGDQLSAVGVQSARTAYGEAVVLTRIRSL